MRLARFLAFLIAALPVGAQAQESVLWGGSQTAGHIPQEVTGGTGQPILIDGAQRRTVSCSRRERVGRYADA